MMKTAIQVEHLTKTYKGFALKDVSFSLPSGMVLGLIGENGAGDNDIMMIVQ